MPRVLKIVPVDGRVGIVLDVPTDEGGVTIYTDEELSAVIDGARRAEREACAKVIDDNSEGFFSGNGERKVFPRTPADRAGLGYADAIRARSNTSK